MQELTSDCAVWMGRTKSKTNEKSPRRTACQIGFVNRRRPAQRTGEGAARCNPAIISETHVRNA